MINWLANPARFTRISARALPWCGWTAAVVLCVGLFWSLVLAPPDYQQGDTVRIMFIHVPAAWMALNIYLFVAVASAVALVWRHPLAEIAARAAAPMGAAFTFVCLATGSLWGRPMWGTWWVWDARLTSVLILFFLYLGYIALVNAFDDPSRGGKAGSILALLMLRMRTVLNERKAGTLRLNAGVAPAPRPARERAMPAHPGRS